MLMLYADNSGFILLIFLVLLGQAIAKVSKKMLVEVYDLFMSFVVLIFPSKRGVGDEWVRGIGYWAYGSGFVEVDSMNYEL